MDGEEDQAMKLITQKRPHGINVANLRPSDIDPWDIAHALASLPRYGGHGLGHYSVAEHSIRLTQLVGERFKFEALLHDAAEAYLGDVIAPLKMHLPRYQELEANAYKTIANVFGLPTRTSEAVEEADKWIRGLELAELFGWDAPEPHPKGNPPRLALDLDHGFTYFLGLFQDLRRR